jgi:hypothetical protein
MNLCTKNLNVSVFFLPFQTSLQRPVLHLEVSTQQEPELHLDVNGQQGPELHLNLSILQWPVLHLEFSRLHELLTLLDVITAWRHML